MRPLLSALLLLPLAACVLAITTTAPTLKKSTTPKPTKAPTDAEICNRSIAGLAAKKQCSACVKHSQCFYCYSLKACKPYPAGHIFPTGTDCPPDMGQARWGTCFVNFKVLLIVMGVLAGLLLFVLPCCIYCCCCRSGRMSERNRKRLAKEESKWQDQENERKTRHAEKREERQKRYDEIRQKYGLVKPEASYQRFENDA